MEIYWLWLSLLPGVGALLQKKLLQRFGSPLDTYHAGEEELLSVEGLGKKKVQQILAARSLDGATSILENVEQTGIRLLLQSDPLYPEMVKSLPEAPPVLYYRGTIREQSCGVGIVGARRCTAYGKEVARQAATFLAKEGIPVISGMARGIDSYANTACLQAGGYTLAFLGHGVDLCFPAENRDLMDAIVERGAVLSEYPPGTEARPEYFPKRNYLISAWSYRLLVVEAARKSGSLITAEIAKQMRRPVLAVPNSIYSRESTGTNGLIEDRAAYIYLRPQQLLPDHQLEPVGDEEIAENTTVNKISAASGEETPAGENKLETLHLETDSACTNKPDIETLSAPEQEILSLLKATGTPCSQEELAMKFSGEKKILLETLTLMMLEGRIENLPGGRVRLSR